MGASINIEAIPIMPVQADKNPLKKKETPALTAKAKKTSQSNTELEKIKSIPEKIDTFVQESGPIASIAKKNKAVKAKESSDTIKKNRAKALNEKLRSSIEKNSSLYIIDDGSEALKTAPSVKN